jgi:hypothetical protein
MFADTGLLAHWGLRLDAPDARGPARRKLGGLDVIAVSPGTLSGRCPISRDRFLADCTVEKGAAIVVADADLLNIERLGRAAEPNLDGLIGELTILERKSIRESQTYPQTQPPGRERNNGLSGYPKTAQIRRLPLNPTLSR